MDYLTYSKRIKYLIELIEKGQLKSCGQAAEKFGCSERTIRRMLNRIRDEGIEVSYSKTGKYYLKN
jgi:transposase